MRLTIEDRPESLNRFGHLKPARPWSTVCASGCPGSTRSCTRKKGHAGPHASHGLFGKVLSVWDAGGSTGQMPRTTKSDTGSGARGRRGPKRPVGLRGRSPIGVLEMLRDVASRAISSAEELVFLVFFVAFVLFAIGGFLLIYLG